jgi:formate dehydrogenase accessory protein FdhD
VDVPIHRVALDTEAVAVTEPIRHSSTRARVVAMNDGVRSERTDTLATEEPLEIRVQGPEQEPVQVAVTMRTPGGDFELAVGFLFTEGLIVPGDVHRVAYCDNLPGEDQRYNVVSVTLDRPFDAQRLRRNFYANSSCGVCGKAALEDIEVRCEPVAPGPEVDLGVLISLPDRLREAQAVFERTGGLHAAGLFDPSGEALSVRDDPAGERAGLVRDRPEGGGGGDPDRERGERPLLAGGRRRRAVRDDAGRVRPRPARERLQPPRACPRLIGAAAEVAA